MSDDSAIFIEDSPARIDQEQELIFNELYKHISPSLSLIPKTLIQMQANLYSVSPTVKIPYNVHLNGSSL